MKPGDRVGRYHIVRELGAGGMGVVYVAHDEALARDVALKVLPAAVTGDAERRARFLREAQAAAAVQHRSIATIHEVGEDGERVFLAMELIDGQTLAEHIAGGSMTPEEAARIALEIARGLSRAHQAGVVHRDLKPGNIMLDRDGEVKLLDFGLAKRTDDAREDDATATALTTDGMVMGTPGYMSPEQAEGGETGAPSDVFALGTVLYEMLSGRMAFGGASTAERIAATLRDTPALLDEGLPEELETLVRELLAKDPARRPTSAQAAARLQAVTSGTASSAVVTRPSAPSPAASMISIVWIAAALIAAIAIGVALALREPESAASAPAADPALLLAKRGVTIACPVFAVSGDKNAPGRIGAAASTEVCDTVDEWIGLPFDTAISAQLLGIDPVGSADTPVAPYMDPDVRKTTLAEARKREAVFDGEVAIEDDAVEVRVRLEDASGAVLASGEARHRMLRIAARNAAIDLLKSAGVQGATLEPDVAAIGNCQDGECLARAGSRTYHVIAAIDAKAQCAALAEETPLVAAAFAERCGHSERDAEGLSTWPAGSREALAKLPPDHQTWWRLALSDLQVAPERQAERREQVEALLARAKHPLAIAVLSSFRASYALLSGDRVAARTSYDRAIETTPRYCNLRGMLNLLTNKSGAQTLAQAATAWCPHVEDLWLIRARLDLDRDRAADMQGMAYLLSGRAPGNARVYAMHLLYVGRSEEVRALASRYLESAVPEARLAGIYIQGRYELSQGGIHAAIDRYRDALLAATPDEDTKGGYQSIFDMMDTERILDRSDAIDAVLESAAWREPFPRAFRMMGVSFVALANHASPPVRGRVLARVRELLSDGRLLTVPDWLAAYLDGCEAFDRGDDAAAVAALRPIISLNEYAVLPVAPFDAAGETDLAMRIDQHAIDWHQQVVTLAHVRQAKRLAARGDHEAARKLAQQVVDAWSTADVKVPAVDEMRQILSAASK